MQTLDGLSSTRNVTDGNGSTVHEVNNTWASGSRLSYPYCIAAGFSIVLVFLLLILHMKGAPAGFPKRKPHRNLRALLSPGSCTAGRISYGAAILVSLTIFFLCSVGAEAVFTSYLFSYAIEADTAFSKSQAADLVTVFYALHLLGRFLCIFLSQCVPTPVLAVGTIVCGIVTMIVGTAFSYDSSIALWVVTGLAGAFMSVLFPTGEAWANLYIEVRQIMLK